MTMRRFLLLCSTLSGLGACDATSPDGAVAVVTDRPEYVLAQGTVTVNGRVENRSENTAEFTGCPQPPSLVVEIFQQNRWRDAGDQGLGCVAIYGPTTTSLRAGEILDFSTTIRQTGLYRLRVFLGPRWGDPDAFAYSNSFTVR